MYGVDLSTWSDTPRCFDRLMRIILAGEVLGMPAQLLRTPLFHARQQLLRGPVQPSINAV